MLKAWVQLIYRRERETSNIDFRLIIYHWASIVFTSCQNALGLIVLVPHRYLSRKAKLRLHLLAARRTRKHASILVVGEEKIPNK